MTGLDSARIVRLTMIQDEHVVDSTPHVRRAKVLVGRVWEVGVAVGFGVEG